MMMIRIKWKKNMKIIIKFDENGNKEVNYLMIKN
jgi:hypothetical protein